MFQKTIKELESLIEGMDFIEESDAKEIIDFVMKIVDEKVGSHICELFVVKAQKKDMKHPKPYLDPFFSLDKTSRQREGPYFIERSTLGLWSWVYKHRIPIWLQGLKSYNHKDPKKHEIADVVVDSKYLEKPWYQTDSIIVIPLLINGNIVGVFSIELPFEIIFSVIVYKQLIQISYCLTKIIVKLNAHKLNKIGKSKAIGSFKKRMQNDKEVIPYDIRTAFLVRPFEDKFIKIDEKIRTYLKKRKVRVHTYTEYGISQDALEKIKEKIQRSHLIIADITDCNSNVMLELGMAIGSSKEYVLFHNKEKKMILPFDIQRNIVHEYYFEDGDLIFADPGAIEYSTIHDIFEPIFTRLEHDRIFKNAKPCDCISAY